MRYPIAPVVRPSDLTGTTNGKLPSNLLTPVKPNEKWQMHHVAARAWEAMRSEAWKDGIKLSVSGNPYRSYDRQAELFNQRYTSTFTPGVNTQQDQRVWNGKRYYKRLGVAAVAVPGTSNHGWGLAVDTAIDADGDLGFEWPPKSIDQNTINWLLANAAKYGFSWELQSEPWHLRYVAGNNVPQAVLDFENPVEQLPVFDPENGKFSLWPLGQKQKISLGSSGDVVRYLQGVLKNKAGQNISVNGVFDQKTDDAVENLQRFFKLKVDGLVGPQTWGIVDLLASL